MQERTKYILLFVGGVAVGAALPIVIPAVIEGGRPLAKALLKHGSIAYQRLQVLAARAAESVEDLLAEVRAEAQPAAAPSEVVMPSASMAPDKKVLS
jgi:hypothetical protein